MCTKLQTPNDENQTGFVCCHLVRGVEVERMGRRADLTDEWISAVYSIHRSASWSNERGKPHLKKFGSAKHEHKRYSLETDDPMDYTDL